MSKFVYFRISVLTALTLALLGCGKQTNPSNSAPLAGGSPAPSGVVIPVASNAHIFGIEGSEGTRQFFAVPDELTTTLLDAITFPNGGVDGERARFSVWGYPSFSEKLRADITSFESSHRGLRVKRVDPMDTLSRTLRQDWIAEASVANTVFFRAPDFGHEVRTIFEVPSNPSFMTTYWLTASGVHFLQSLENNPKTLKNFYRFKFCYQASADGFDGKTRWQGNVCVSSP